VRKPTIAVISGKIIIKLIVKTIAKLIKYEVKLINL
jgi:hypothetical protein